MISLHEPFFSGNEKKYVKNCLDQGWVSSAGKYVELFEEKISPRKILSDKIKEYNIPIYNLKSIKEGNDFINQNGELIKNRDLTTQNRKGFSYAFCSDTKYNEDIIPFIKNVDLLYHETTFIEVHKDRAIRTNHSTTKDAGNIAKKSEVKKLLIGHFSQRYKKDKYLLEETRKFFQNTIIAKQGETIDFSSL